MAFERFDKLTLNTFVDIKFIMHNCYWEIELDMATYNFKWKDKHNINTNGYNLTNKEKTIIEVSIKEYIDTTYNKIRNVCQN